ncbi:hypothetical protein [Brevundimonas naejangsanensis]
MAIISKKPDHISDGEFSAYYAQVEANARLIAAAPDLFEALKKSAEGWANALEFGLIPPQHRDTATILRDEARAALSKATTQQEGR